MHPVYGGIIRAYGAVWAGRDVLYAAVNTGLGGSANIYYSSDEGLSWGKKSGLGSSVWMPRVLVDPTDQAVSYAGYGFNGPELVKATAVSGGYSQIDGDYQAGIAIYYGYGTGWISSLDGRYVRTSRGGYLYFSDDGGATWNRSLGAFEGGIWGDDDAPNNMITARDESGELNSPHILKSTTNLGLDWHNKGGAHATLPIQVVVILFPITVAG